MRSFAIHASMLSMLSKCGMMAYYRYIEGRKSPPGVALLVGTATHRSIERNLTAKITTGSLLSAAEAKQAAADAFESAWVAEPPQLDEDEKAMGADVVRGKAKDTSLALAELHHKSVAPGVVPVAVELKLRVVDPNASMFLNGSYVQVAIEGTVDVLDGRALLIDNKTAAKAPSGSEAAGNVQLDTYAWLLDRHNRPVKRQRLDYLVKTATPKYVPVESDASSDFSAIVQRFQIAAKMMESGSFMPVDPSGPSGWACSAKWCGYWPASGADGKPGCPFGQRRVKQVQVPKEAKS